MQDSLNGIQKDVKSRPNAAWARKVIMKNYKSSLIWANLELSDYVLDVQAQRKGHKLQCIWSGPRKILSVNIRLLFCS